MTSTWQSLQPGDRVAVIAPSAKTEQSVEEFLRCLDYLAAFGLDPIVPGETFGTGPSYYPFANSHSSRIACFQAALASDARAIFCFRGGCGCDHLAYACSQSTFKPPLNPKLIIGFSDITHLHFLALKWQWPSLHAPVLRQLMMRSIDVRAIELTESLLFGQLVTLDVPLTPANLAAEQLSTLATRLAGGNLSVIGSILGTTRMPNLAGYTLVLEDINEEPRKVARMLLQLRATAWWHDLHAVILGDFFAQDSQITQPTLMAEVLTEFANDALLPVFQTTFVGHHGQNYPLALHVPTTLSGGKKSQLSISNPYCNLK